MDTIIISVAITLVVAAAAFALLHRFNAAHKVEEVTTEALIATALTAIDEAQRLADSRASAIESDQAALAADRARIAAARAKMANATPVA